MECIVTWVENGTAPKIEHKVSKLNGQMDMVGDPHVRDLERERYYVSKDTVFDKSAQDKWLENEKLRKAREKDEKSRLKGEKAYLSTDINVQR